MKQQESTLCLLLICLVRLVHASPVSAFIKASRRSAQRRQSAKSTSWTRERNFSLKTSFPEISATRSVKRPQSPLFYPTARERRFSALCLFSEPSSVLKCVDHTYQITRNKRDLRTPREAQCHIHNRIITKQSRLTPRHLQCQFRASYTFLLYSSSFLLKGSCNYV